MTKKWWHDKVAYQIYPKSFLDTNDDGIGDLRGIISKLDYLKELGIDIIWLSPVYESPFVDQGYDISDYYKIAEVFGSMDEFDELLSEAKKRDMYIIMDLVVNHCSDQHEWFQKALADPYGEYGDYFYFRKGKDGNPPSNYRSYFGGSTWEKVDGTKDLYYLHLFAKEQPDLNWENETVRNKIYEMVNWWLDKGVAGFRIDAIINIKKVLSFPSYEPDGIDGLVSCTKMIDEAEGVGTFLEELKNHTFAKKDAFTVGEVFNMKPDELKEFIGENGHFSTMFDFSAQELDLASHGWYDVKPVCFKEWRDTIFASQLEMLDIGFKANIIENHDEPRGASRYLPDHAKNDAGKKMLAATSLLLRGLPFLYQGQEIGMTNCKRNDISEYDDINTIDQYQLALDAGCSKEEALHACYMNSRDNARTPMQWENSPNAGFSSHKPWLAINPNYTVINVADQQSDRNSVLNFYKELIRLRKSPEYKECFTYGGFTPVFTECDDIFAYLRTLEESHLQILVAANYGTKVQTLHLPSKMQEMLLSNMVCESELSDVLRLDSCQVVVVRLKGND